MTVALVVRFLVIMWYIIITYFIAYGVLTDPDAVEELNTPEVQELPNWLVLVIIAFTCALWPIWVLRRLSHLPSKLKKYISRPKAKPDDEAIKSDEDVDTESWRNYWRN